ncbi:unnamed protein product [Pseudo-nitzschia multistriata]|uniref:Sulfotransferase domain-containing protein n=1 Tax=Pseudo-nitzschia multistriata TaxID=183589 RepID=A0A448YY70_9STRA|nr:unnamed protein product [Pseudo-nitzschia multistriata]
MVSLSGAPSLVRRRRTTTLAAVLPFVLLVLTAATVWFRPSSYYHDFFHRDGIGIGEVAQTDPLASASAPKSAPGSNPNNHEDDGPAKMVPAELLELGVYDESRDFVNERGFSPTGWEEPNADPTVWGPCRFTPVRPGSSFSMAADVSWADRRRWTRSNETANATALLSRSDDYYRNADPDDFEYRVAVALSQLTGHNKSNEKHPPFKGGWCRPGFLIIGAGKCGTSSLYHYLMGHPRIVPAIEKQIHYFKYHANTRPLAWYYGHFPTPQSFLDHGALMTGEASPGYLPYPEVAKLVHQTYGGTGQDGAGTDVGMSLQYLLGDPAYRKRAPAVPPRIIAVGREPLDRMYSSYRYNYVVPTIEHLRSRGHPAIRKHRRYGTKAKKKSSHKEHASEEFVFELNHPDDEYYMPYLFTLEEFVRAELKQLRGYLFELTRGLFAYRSTPFSPQGPRKTYMQWRRDSIYGKTIKLRNGAFVDNESSIAAGKNATDSSAPPPLIALDDVCYGKSVNKTVYREQWAEMQMNNPEKKVLLNKNLHLTQALIGRSLYTFPLEWWYLDVHKSPQPPIFVCTDELTDSETLSELTAQLGLPAFDGFDQVLAEGAYNVGGHRGYDTATSWEELELEKQQKEQQQQNNDESSSRYSSSGSGGPNRTRHRYAAAEDVPTAPKGAAPGTLTTNGIPLPEDLYRELKDFVDPLNERLFALTGKRCNW